MTDLWEIVDPEDFQRGLDDDLIGVKEGPEGYRIFNYTKKAQVTKGAWDNPAVRQCRGLIVDGDNNVKARPWEKFFNYGQAEAAHIGLDEIVEVTDKMDGSLGILFEDWDGLPRIATRGSFFSDQAIHATEVLRTKYPEVKPDPDFTTLFEIIYPDNRIVCDYGDQDDLVLLGEVAISCGLEPFRDISIRALPWRGPVAKMWPRMTLGDALALPPRPGAEGIVVTSTRNAKVKVKQEDYVRLHRIVTGLSEKSVWEAMVAEKKLDEFLADLPDELHEWTREVWGKFDAEANRITGAVVDLYMVAAYPVRDRGEYARWAKQQEGLTSYLFTMLDKGAYAVYAQALKSLKPVGESQRAKVVSNDAD